MTNAYANTDFTARLSNIEASIARLDIVVSALDRAAKRHEKEARDIDAVFDEIHSSGATYPKFSSSKDPEKRALYIAYQNINARCNNPNHPAYKNYGGRGIKNKFSSFEQFARHMGFRPGSRYSVDRIDNSRGYEPGNVRWATWEEQANNRRAPSQHNPDAKKRGPKGPWKHKKETMH